MKVSKLVICAASWVFMFPAIAVTVLPGLPTGFEIDGNKPTTGTNEAGTGVSFDWENIFGDGINPPSGVPPYAFTFPSAGVTPVAVSSTGIVASSFNTDGVDQATACDTHVSDLGFGGGDKIDTNPWAPTTNTVATSKADACSGAAALEVVKINSQGDFPNTGDAGFEQIHYILYNYWSRTFDANGEMVVFQVLRGTNNSISASGEEWRCDDRLIEFDYNSSMGGLVVEINSLIWQPDPGESCDGQGAWVDSGIQVGVGTGGLNVDPVDNGAAGANPNTFGESAIDLTTAGILDEGECSTFTNEGFISKTGNGSGGTVDSFTFATPIVISNCTDVEITKASEDNYAFDFSYHLDQTDGRPTHDSSLIELNNSGVDTDADLSSISSVIQIGETDIWRNVLAEPDYRLVETQIPTDWLLEDIVCTYYDPFIGATIVDQISPAQDDTGLHGNPVAFVDESSGDDVFTIPPPVLTNVITSCIITNDFPFPTQATISEISIRYASVDEFLSSIDIDNTSTDQLYRLLQSWSPQLAAMVDADDRADILSSIRSFLDPDGDGNLAVINWGTIDENGTIGFYVERRTQNGGWITINEKLLPGLIVAPYGGEYSLVDPHAQIDQRLEYRLIEEEARGNSRRYGPYNLELINTVQSND